MFIIPNPFKDPKAFALLALALTGLAIVVGGMLGLAKLVLPPLAAPIERRGTGIRAVDAAIGGVGQKIGAAASGLKAA